MATNYDPGRDTGSWTEGTSGGFPQNGRSRRGYYDPYGTGGGTEGVFPQSDRAYDSDSYGPSQDDPTDYSPEDYGPGPDSYDPYSYGPGGPGSDPSGGGQGLNHGRRSNPARAALIAICAVLGAVILLLLYFLLRPEKPQPPTPTVAAVTGTPALPQVTPTVPTGTPTPATPVPTPIPPTAAPVPLRDQILAWAEDADQNAEDYSIVSDKGTHLYIPDDQYFLEQPFPMMVDAKKDTEYPGSRIYLIPSYEDKYGNLGRLRHGTIVTVYAVQNGMYFVVGPEGQAGWNGPSYFSEP